MMVPDSFHDAIAVTPHDTNENRFAALRVLAEASDTVAIEPASGGEAVTFTMAAGENMIWCATHRVLSSGTTGDPEIIGLR